MGSCEAKKDGGNYTVVSRLQMFMDIRVSLSRILKMLLFNVSTLAS